jgi:hypothetical protein
LRLEQNIGLRRLKYKWGLAEKPLWGGTANLLPISLVGEMSVITEGFTPT